MMFALDLAQGVLMTKMMEYSCLLTMATSDMPPRRPSVKATSVLFWMNWMLVDEKSAIDGFTGTCDVLTYPNFYMYWHVAKEVSSKHLSVV